MSTRSTCALALLCLVQGCERFAFSAMMPLFVLYLHHQHGFSEPAAMVIIGVFQALSYVAGLPGGIATDRKLGGKTALSIGVALLMFGYGLLALARPGCLWFALTVLVLGHGLFKPSMSASLGGLSSNSSCRERSFLWQYMAINLGTLLGPLYGERASAEHRWNLLFLGAALAMVAASVAVAAGVRSRPSSRYVAPSATPATCAQAEARARAGAVWAICGLAAVIWLTSQQATSSLVVFAEEHTEKALSVWGGFVSVGAARFASLHALMVLVLLPLFIAAMDGLRRHGAEPSTPVKMLWGFVITALAFALLSAAGLRGGDTGRVSAVWLGCCYLLMSVAELLLGPLGAALLTRIAPPHRTAQTVGLWYAAAAVGNVAAGALGLWWESWPHHLYFALLSMISLGAAVALFILLPGLKRLLVAQTLPANGGSR